VLACVAAVLAALAVRDAGAARTPFLCRSDGAFGVGVAVGGRCCRHSRAVGHFILRVWKFGAVGRIKNLNSLLF